MENKIVEENDMAINQTAELEKLLQKAFDQKASDIFLLANEPVSFRINGKIERTEGEILSAKFIREIVLAAFGEDVVYKIGREMGEAITSCSLPGVVTGQMCVGKSRGDYSLTIHLILTGKIPTPKEIRFPEKALNAAVCSHGLVIFSGLTGSGKTTTMLSILDHINATKPCHICTIEDPIAYHLTPKKAIIQQREIGSDIPNVLAGISVAMHQDLDVILIGDLNSAEEVQAAITAAQYGHLVFVQLHAPSPQKVIQRLVDIQPEENRPLIRRLLAELVRLISVQTLIPGTKNKKVVAYSTLIPDENFRSLIASSENIEKFHLPKDSLTLEEDINNLHKQGLIDDKEKAKAIQNLKTLSHL